MKRPALALLMMLVIFAQSAPATSNAASLPAPVNLQREGQAAASEGKPVLILFSMPGCSFCHVVRRNYLLPLVRAALPVDRPVIRELDITSAKTFVGFDGKLISHAQLAKAYMVKVVPTVLFLGPSGRQLTEPIVGGDIAGMYGAYLENAFAAAGKKLTAERQRINEETKR